MALSAQTILVLGALSSTALFSCGNSGNRQAGGGDDPADAGIDASVCDPVFKSSHPFQLIDAPHTEIEATSVTLTRDQDANTISVAPFSGAEFPGGEVVTVWWAVFNKPEECTSPNAEIGALCGVPDMTSNPAVEGALLYAGPHPDGFIRVPDAGVECPDHQICTPTFPNKLTLSQIEVGAVDDPFKNAGPGNGLNDVRTSEIHLIMQKHGAALEGDALLSQETTFNGGCLPGEAYAEVAGACALFQVAVFQPLPACE